MRPGSTRARVLEAVRGLGQASLTQIRELTGLTDKADHARVYKAVAEFRREGRLVHKGPALYAYREIGPQRGREVLTRMWRAMCASRSGFTSRDVSDIASASRDHTKKFITWLLRNGYLEVAGRRALPGVDTRFNVYRMRPERRGREVPPYSRPRRRPWATEWERLKAAGLGIVRQINELGPRDAEKLQALEESAEAFKAHVAGLRGRLEESAKKGVKP